MNAKLSSAFMAMMLCLVGWALPVFAQNATPSPEKVLECADEYIAHIGDLGRVKCADIDDFDDFIAENPVCAALEEDVKTKLATFCSACGEAAACKAKPAATSGGKGTSKGSDTVTLPKDGMVTVEEREATEAEMCKLMQGVPVTEYEDCREVVETRGDKVIVRKECKEVNKCFTLEHAWQRLKTLEEWVKSHKETKHLTEEEVNRLIQIYIETHPGGGESSKWPAKFEETDRAVRKLCAPFEEGEPLVASCEALRRQVEKNTKDIAEMKPVVEETHEAVTELCQPKEGETLPEACKRQRSGLFVFGSKPLFSLAARGGFHAVPTRNHNETVGYGGVEFRLFTPEILPKLRLDLKVSTNGTSEVIGANRVMVEWGAGIAYSVHPDVLLGVDVGGEHFLTIREFSIMNTYGIGPNVTWAPGLGKKTGGVVPMLGAGLRGGVDRVLLPNGLESQFQVSGNVFAGIMF